MMLDHGRIEELLAVRALSGLDGDDVRDLENELRAHGPDCQECRRLEREFDETAAMIAFSLDPEPVDAGLADRILATPQVAGEQKYELAARRASKSRRIWGGLIGVAASVALIVVGFAILSPGDQPINQVSPGDTFVQFEGENGQLALAYSPGQPGVLVVGTDVPDPGKDKVYELWTFDGKTPISAGCMTPVDGSMGASLPNVTPTETMAVTVESDVCPDAPAGEVAFTATLA